MWRSQTGRRLQKILPDGCEVFVGEASPFIGSTSRSRFLMDPDYVKAQIAEFAPDVVVLLGDEARKARSIVEEQGIVVVMGPHPTWRALSKQMVTAVREQIQQVVDKPLAVTIDI